MTESLGSMMLKFFRNWAVLHVLLSCLLEQNGRTQTGYLRSVAGVW